ncbi:hypothetical protein [Deinococcus sp.]|uniref:hypothetical protein n=1 Tax=Deinococcus sp. TaxID=47478 RepID=UPI003CC68F8A
MLKELSSVHLDTIHGGIGTSRTINVASTAPTDSLASILGLSAPTGLFFQKPSGSVWKVIVVPHRDRSAQPKPYTFAPNPYLNDA